MYSVYGRQGSPSKIQRKGVDPLYIVPILKPPETSGLVVETVEEVVSIAERVGVVAERVVEGMVAERVVEETVVVVDLLDWFMTLIT